MKSPLISEALPTDLVVIVRAGFPRIADAIEYTWGSKECVEYLNKLIIDYRGDRSGFSHSVFDALVKLYNLHPSVL